MSKIFKYIMVSAFLMGGAFAQSLTPEYLESLTPAEIAEFKKELKNSEVPGNSFDPGIPTKAQQKKDKEQSQEIQKERGWL